MRVIGTFFCLFAFLVLAFNNCGGFKNSSIVEKTTSLDATALPANASVAANENSWLGGTLSIPLEEDPSAANSVVSYGRCLRADDRPDGGWCIRVQRPGHTQAQIVITAKNATTPAAFCSAIAGGTNAVEAIGDFTGDGVSELAVISCRVGTIADGSNTNVRTVLSIVDVVSGNILDETISPDVGGRASLRTVIAGAYINLLKGPDGKKYPILAPGYGDTLASAVWPAVGPNGPLTYGTPIWGYTCVYDPANRMTKLSRCGSSRFARVPTTPHIPYDLTFYASKGGYYRESGGYVYDYDGDGWEDFSLIYHFQILTLSGKTGDVLSETSFNSSESTAPSQEVPYFHSGRNYGIHVTVKGGDGHTRTVILAGAPVGELNSEIYAECNVSRFVGVLDWTTGEPAGRHLAWSQYYGFYPAIFKRTDPTNLTPLNRWREPDLLNGCIHHFGLGVAMIDGQQSVMFNYFHQTSDKTACVTEQYDYTYGSSDQRPPWPACMAKQQSLARGSWNMHAYDLKTGALVSSGENTYIWGTSSFVIPANPSREAVYLVETLPSEVSYDLGEVPPPRLSVRTLKNGMWHTEGVFPIAGVPKIRVMVKSETGFGNSGTPSSDAAFNGYARLIEQDQDGDGLNEIAVCPNSRDSKCPLSQVVWIGYDRATGQFVKKGG